MKSLTEEHLSFLSRFGFDPELFESWRKAVRDGSLSLENNEVTGQLLAPAPDQIRSLPREDSEDRQELFEIGKAAIANGEFGVVILNGGMATRFGGVVKGTVDVVGETSFLGLKLHDVRRAEKTCGGTIPVMLMNSFATDEATTAHCREHEWFGLPKEQVDHFTQFISVRLDEKGNIFEPEKGQISPYGPGHGDFSFALRHSGLLQRFLENGGKYLMLQNVDNLGARVSPAILGHHIQNRAEITCECAPKWPGDVGGSPFVLDGKLQLVEQLRFPAGFDPDIVDVFNTNTFHFSASSIDRDFELGWYYVEKAVGDRKAIQIERLVGELTKHLKSNFVRVKRTGDGTRFLPIKTPDDLESARDEVRELYDEP
ncbi:MAG: UTP--glucose-1-phosphate uridylyltransferase [Planctomycetes bacterium]|nr:UTP--glucose-1-phosphate uridylyltransferase [Planctomycetota bacterium]